MPSVKDMEKLGEKCKQLDSFKANILRSSAMDSVEWTRKDDKWEGGVTPAKTRFASSTT